MIFENFIGSLLAPNDVPEASFFRQFWDVLGCVWEWFGDVFGWVWDGFGKKCRTGSKNEKHQNDREYVSSVGLFKNNIFSLSPAQNI